MSSPRVWLHTQDTIMSQSLLMFRTTWTSPFGANNFARIALHWATVFFEMGRPSFVLANTFASSFTLTAKHRKACDITSTLPKDAEVLFGIAWKCTVRTPRTLPEHVELAMPRWFT